MGIDRIVYVPIFNTPKASEPKGNGSKRGRTPGLYQYRPNNLGISYPLGLGCMKHDNCFTCTKPDCKFSGTGEEESFLANRGDGIKVW